MINIHSTEFSEPLAGSVSAEAGRYDTTNVVGALGGTSDKFNYYVAGSSFRN
ncbi:hypothetical protein RS130_20910 [Paraglaciecola aquimarina]|uniref:Uncharacterized protein n=1 Tax=Paraglaciecola aquimarina TaxID=1235557 RepID=A0ABU3T194_9ALTE|nr:hypothetical protein [Paraglaciecola aquimarina]MDU0356021.1 hypothetical protein [Paraglaciecola aquimarina]